MLHGALFEPSHAGDSAAQHRSVGAECNLLFKFNEHLLAVSFIYGNRFKRHLIVNGSMATDGGIIVFLCNRGNIYNHPAVMMARLNQEVESTRSLPVFAT